MYMYFFGVASHGNCCKLLMLLLGVLVIMPKQGVLVIMPKVGD